MNNKYALKVYWQHFYLDFDFVLSIIIKNLLIFIILNRFAFLGLNVDCHVSTGDRKLIILNDELSLGILHDQLVPNRSSLGMQRTSLASVTAYCNYILFTKVKGWRADHRSIILNLVRITLWCRPVVFWFWIEPLSRKYMCGC